MRKFTVASMATLILLVLAVPAIAHVTVQPTNAPNGSFFRFDVRVPNERDDAGTVKVEVSFPDNLTNVSFQPKDGWQRTVTMKTLDEPITVFGREVTEVVDTVTWEGGTIEPGEFDEFGFSARTPDDPATLVFPSIQTYSSGEEVAWIGEPDSDEPAPRVEVAAAADGGDGSSGSTTALIVGGLGLIAGLSAIAMNLRRRSG